MARVQATKMARAAQIIVSVMAISHFAAAQNPVSPRFCGKGGRSGAARKKGSCRPLPWTSVSCFGLALSQPFLSTNQSLLLKTHPPQTNLNKGQFDRLAGTSSGFTGQLGEGSANGAAEAAAPVATCDASTPAKVVIQAVRAVATDGRPAAVTLRNIGGQPANLTGHTLSTPFSGDVLKLGEPPRQCGANATLAPGRTVTYLPRSDANPCGLPFVLNAT
jgi:hypothetical protein